MDLIDLHVHSNASDGSLSPAEVIDEAYRSGLRAIALTDHDTGKGLKEARDAVTILNRENHADFELVSGTELSAEYHGEEVHILGYFIDETCEEFQKVIQLVVSRREERNQKMAENFTKAGFPITMEELTAGNPDTIITRSHFARVMVEKGYVKNRQEAFQKYLGREHPYYVKREYLTPKEAISAIRAAGGIAVLAHPVLYHFTPEKLDLAVHDMKQAGLSGLEAIYTTYSIFEESDMKRLARKYGLLITGGSDFHGENKPQTHIGSGYGGLKIPYELLINLKERRNLS